MWAWIFHRFFFDIDFESIGFFIAFSRILVGFLKIFRMIFGGFCRFSWETLIFKIRAPTQCFVRVGRSKINEKCRNTPCNDEVNLEWQNQGSQIAQKLDVGVSWAPFWKVFRCLFTLIFHQFLILSWRPKFQNGASGLAFSWLLGLQLPRNFRSFKVLSGLSSQVRSWRPFQTARPGQAHPTADPRGLARLERGDCSEIPSL